MTMPTSPAAPRGVIWRVPGPIGHSAYRRAKQAGAAGAAADFQTLMKGLGATDTCLDLGAHRGTVTTQMAATGAQVHAVEPDPDNFAKLTEATQHLENVTCHEAAIGLGSAPLTLRRARNYHKRPEGRSMASSVVRTNPFAMDGGEGLQVAQLDLMALIDGFDKPPALIKMDVEGAEWPLLDALLARETAPFTALFVETHERFNPWRLIPKLTQLHRKIAARPDRYVNLYWH